VSVYFIGAILTVPFRFLGSLVSPAMVLLFLSIYGLMLV